MSFREDESRVRERNATENLALIRRLALNLLKNSVTKKKRSIRLKRMAAGLDPLYALRVTLGGVPAEIQPIS